MICAKRIETAGQLSQHRFFHVIDRHRLQCFRNIPGVLHFIGLNGPLSTICSLKKNTTIYGFDQHFTQHLSQLLSIAKLYFPDFDPVFGLNYIGVAGFLATGIK